MRFLNFNVYIQYIICSACIIQLSCNLQPEIYACMNCLYPWSCSMHYYDSLAWLYFWSSNACNRHNHIFHVVLYNSSVIFFCYSLAELTVLDEAYCTYVFLMVNKIFDPWNIILLYFNQWKLIYTNNKRAEQWTIINHMIICHGEEHLGIYYLAI